MHIFASMRSIHKDLISGLAVFLVAIPLCLGIALASGAPMAAGLLGGIIGGIIVGAISGSSTSVSGPAAGLTAIVLAAITEIGSFEAFLVALILSGVLQLLLAAFKAGGIASFFPTSVIKGLLTSIGIILVFKQIPHAFGYDRDTEGDFDFEQADHENTFSEVFEALNHLQFGAIVVSIVCLLIMIYWAKLVPKKISMAVPASLIVVIVAILMNEFFNSSMANLFIEQSHRVTLPEGMSLQNAGKLITLPDFNAIGNITVWKIGITLAIVASLETLLNIEASDKLDEHGRKTPPNRELLAQGFGNVVSGFVGGLPVTSVIVRSSVNINTGAVTKFSAIFHGIFLLVFILIFPDLLSKIPLSALAAILITTGFKLIKFSDFKNFYKKGWDQFIPFIITILAIVFSDLLIGVAIGLVAAVFYILRSNFKNPFTFVREEYQNRKILKLELSQQVSFFHKAALENTIERVAENSHILIDGSRTDFLDKDVRETLTTYKHFGVPEKHVNFSFTGFHHKHKIPDEINFPYVLSKEMLEDLKPDEVLDILKKGNARFVNGKSQKKDLLRQVQESSSAQFPTAVVLGCIDSRSAAELIFDQGFGDIVNIRIAGNVVNKDILGSIEFACHILGAKLVVVLGHTSCGAVKAALSDSPSGHVGPLIDKIKVSLPKCDHIHDKDEKLFELTVENINHSIDEIRHDTNLNSLLDSGKVKIIGAMYDIHTGVVDFYE